jgi:hypothetical protein
VGLGWDGRDRAPETTLGLRATSRNPSSTAVAASDAQPIASKSSTTASAVLSRLADRTEFGSSSVQGTPDRLIDETRE